MNVFGGLSANLTFMSFDATYIMGDKYTMQCNLNLARKSFKQFYSNNIYVV